jgi:hypothetical protein
MDRSHSKKPGLLDALLSVTVDPRGTTSLLLNSPGSPPYGLTVLSLFLVLYVIAPLLHQGSGVSTIANLNSLAPVLIASVLTFLFASFFIFMGLQVLGSPRPLRTTLAVLGYCTSPLVSLMLLAIAASFVMRGSPTVIMFLASGYAAPDDAVAQVVPYLLKITVLLSLMILTQAMRAITNSSLALSALAALCCIPLILGAFVIALTLTDKVFPQSSSRTIFMYQSMITIQ